MDKLYTVECRKCNSTNIKVYDDGSGFCQNCGDAFPDVSKYLLKPKMNQEKFTQQQQTEQPRQVHIDSERQENRSMFSPLLLNEEFVNKKLIVGMLFYSLSFIAFIFMVFVPSTICWAALLGLLCFVIGLLFMIGAGVESIQEYRKGNRSISVQATILILIMLFLPLVISFIFPEFHDENSDFISRLSIVGLILGFFYILYIQKPKQKG